MISNCQRVFGSVVFSNLFHLRIPYRELTIMILCSNNTLFQIMYVFLQILNPEWRGILDFMRCLFGCIWFQGCTRLELTIFFLLTMLSQATTIHLYLLASFDHLLSHTVIRYYSILLGKKKKLPTSYSAHFLITLLSR